MKRVLTAEDMQIAVLAVANVTDGNIAKQVGLRRETVCKKRKWPEMIAYMEKLQAPLKAKIAKQAKDTTKEAQKGLVQEYEEIAKKTEQAAAQIVWNFEESARRKLKIADDGTARDSDRLTAIKALDEMYGIGNAQPPKLDGDQIPETPSFYKSEWRQ